MKLDIILSGVGGQGILSIAAIIGEAALRKGLHVKQAEVHGMSQRGGDVQSNLRLSSSPIDQNRLLQSLPGRSRTGPARLRRNRGQNRGVRTYARRCGTTTERAVRRIPLKAQRLHRQTRRREGKQL